MNVKELKQHIQDLPDEMEVCLTERKTEFEYGHVNTAYIMTINMVETPGGKT